MFIAVTFIIVKIGNNKNVLELVNGYRTAVYVYNEILFNNNKE